MEYLVIGEVENPVLLKMVEDSYIDNKDVLSIKFNGWLFEGYEDAKSVLMGTILEQIIKNRTLDEEGKSNCN